MIITINNHSIIHISRDLCHIANMKLLDTYIPNKNFPWVTLEYAKKWLSNKFLFEQKYDYHLIVNEFMETINKSEN